MPSPFHLLEGLGKVIALRFKRPKTQGRTQHDLTTADHEGNSSIPTDISNSVPTPMRPSISLPVHPVSTGSRPSFEEFSTGFPSIAHAFGASPAREASDFAQLALPLVQAFTGVIPLVGAPINAAIGGLLAILQAIDRCDQNRTALDDLTSQLHRLYYHLCNAPSALDALEYSRRDVLARKLQDTSESLRKLQKRRLPYASLSQAITRCSADINRYMMEYLLSSQMQSQRDTRELVIMLQRRQEGTQNIQQSFTAPTSSHSAGTIAGCVTLVDATGHHHPISVNWCTSYQQLNNMLRLLFERDGIEAQVQRRYIEQGKYDLCIDQGTQVTLLTNDKWSSIEPGTTIVMRVAIEQKTDSGSDVDYRCHFCGIVNRLGVESVKYWAKSQTVCSTDCRECKRRFQITRRVTTSLGSSNSNSDHKTEAEALLIRNFHIQQISSWSEEEWEWESSELLLKLWKLESLKLKLKLLESLNRREFVRRVGETSVMHPRQVYVPPSYDIYSGSSSIEEIA